MQLSTADRDAILAQFKTAAEASAPVWTASRRLDKEQFTLTVDIAAREYTITLTGEGESIRTKTVPCRSETNNETSKEFFQDIGRLLDEMTSRMSANSDSL